ncbi:MAG: ImmA/IrrE family metallo-endopeptidase [Bacteroides sp.]|nr:ImmA/IrrE family metallo-endopeptidase [Prevotella sp.]MCM1407531.1 ImmA/IrrE family metallo-endopeptidase [Treponema brennaborense]MCM1470021.1 ImmA/IrrE family metallo-endopeptidase [Bacteroides sp.]
MSDIFASLYFSQGESSGYSKLPAFRCEEIKEIVADIIEEYGVVRIPIDVFALAKRLGIRLVAFSDLTECEREAFARHGITADSDGFYVLSKKGGILIPFIFYNDCKPWERIRFTILHEIAHHVLDHRQQSDLAETEANFFAKYLIAPPVLVHKIKPSDYMDIEEAFGVSWECAWNAFDYYKKWRRHYMNRGCRYEKYETRILAACADGI